MNLAIISPGQNIYSETFIQAHKSIKADKVLYYYGGTIPSFVEGEGVMNLTTRDLSKKTLLKLLLTINPFSMWKNKFSLKEYLFARSLKKHKVDVVLAEFGPTGVACMNVCSKLGIPLITHFHGYDITKILDEYKDSYQELFKNNAAIIGVSKEMVQTIISLGANPSKVVYTPCGPNPMFFETQKEDAGPIFVSVGRFVDKKAPYYTILAFQKVVSNYPDAKLLMVGDGPLLEVCKNLTKQLGLNNNVEFLGVRSPKEIQSLLGKAIAYVQHSLTAANGDKEGTPVGVMEASAAGLPVVSTLHAGIPDVIINGETGLLSQEHDVEGMAKNMMWIIDHPDEAKVMGVRGKMNIRKNFSLENHIGILSSTVSKAYLNSTE